MHRHVGLFVVLNFPFFFCFTWMQWPQKRAYASGAEPTRSMATDDVDGLASIENQSEKQ